jgi:hypothetical protein
MNRKTLLLKAALAAAAIPRPATAAQTTATQTTSMPSPNATSTGALLPRPPQDSVDAAIAAPLTRYNRNLKGGAHTNMGHSGGAPVVLALAAFTGDTRADTRLLEQIRYTLTGGNDISANGGYPAQHERNVTAMFALARHTPRVWSQLSPGEITRIDLLMKAALVASAFTTSDNNPFVRAKTRQYALDGDANLNRGWNPNYREGMLGMLLVAPVYLGGTQPAQALLDTYDHAAFVRELQRHGLTNLHETFSWKAAHPDSNAPSGPMIEQAIRNYRYLGTALGETMRLYWLLTSNTYGKRVNCGLNEGKGVVLPDGSRAGMLLSGCEALPNKGKPGMLKELDSNDAGGRRSSTLYGYDGFRVNLVNQLVLVAGGLWRPGSKQAEECLSLLKVGIPDLWYKIEHGYRNYAKGGLQQGTPGGNGMVLTRPLWDAVLKPYHRLP